MDQPLRSGIIVGRLVRIGVLIGALIATALLGQTLATIVIAVVLIAESAGTLASIVYVKRQTRSL